MSIDITRGYDSFGPPSEPISIHKFLDDTASLVFPSAVDVFDHVGWQSLPDDERSSVEAECSGSVAELKATVERVWDDPMLSAHLYRTHAAAVNTVCSQAGGPTSKSRKRKRLPDPETAEAQPEVRALQEELDAISLRCWGLNKESAFFVRAPKHSDFNALEHVKKSGHGALTSDQPSSQASHLAGTHPPPSPAQCPLHRDSLVTLTVYNRVPWIHTQLTRLSQHVVLSSQTLADLIRVVPCDSSEMPDETTDSQGDVVRYTYEKDEETAEEGCLLLIEGVAYGDGRTTDDYAEKLLSHLQMLPEEKRQEIVKSPASLSQTLFASLTLRINQPYWMLHQGSCEHFVVVDEIRLAHPLDPSSGYPLTVHVAPTVGDTCKACAKVPAVLTVIGDIRLGESPCLLCAPCWRNMGPPREEDTDQVMVVPLVRHRRAWQSGMDI